jgi:hypothetical protein
MSRLDDLSGPWPPGPGGPDKHAMTPRPAPTATPGPRHLPLPGQAPARSTNCGCLPGGAERPVRRGNDGVLAAKRVTRPDGTDIRLTPTEWHLLEHLLRHPGKLLSQRQLLAEVWGPGYADATGNLRLYMTQLRRKLEPDPGRRPPCPRRNNNQNLLTQRGVRSARQPGM